jgi:hypothetical protein
MSTALLGYGTIFQTGDGNSPGETFTSFIEVTNIAMPTARVDVIDTSHEMPPLSTRESFPGMMDWGEVQISFNYVPGNASALALISETQAKPIRNRKIILPNGRTWSFAAYLTGWETIQAAGDKLSGSATFQITGDVTFT